MSGSVVTFYSYKGGVGRTFLLANVGVLLARWGHRVLMIDLDLEAPGLPAFFRTATREPQNGFVDLVHAATGPGLATDPLGRPVLRSPAESPYLSVGLDGTADRLDLLPAGGAGDRSIGVLRGFLFGPLFETYDFGRVFEDWRTAWAQHYDFVLVDSRTGEADIAGLTTVLLPDILVLLSTTTHQSIEGVEKIWRAARTSRAGLTVDRAALLPVPVLARWDESVPTLARDGEGRFLHHFRELFDAWRHPDATPERLVEHLRIPHDPRWGYAEALPVLSEGHQARAATSWGFANVAALLEHHLEGSERLVGDRDGYVAESEGSRVWEHPYFLALPADDWGRSVAEALAAAGCPAWPGAVPTRHAVSVMSEGFARSERLVVVSDRLAPVLRGGFEAAAPGRRILEVGAREPGAIVDQVLAFLGRPPRDVPAPDGPDGPLRAALRERHRNLLVFFPEAPDRLLEEVYVELEVAPSPPKGRGDPEAPLRFELEGVQLPERRARTLDALLASAPSGKGARVLLLGEPGAGKSTLLRHLCHRRAESGPLALFLSLSKASGRLRDVWEEALEPLKIARTPALRAWLEAATTDGLLLLLDGLDEVPPERMEETCRWIRALAVKHPKAGLVVTGRPVVDQLGFGLGKEFVRAEVQKLDVGRRDRLLEHLVGEEDAAALAEELARQPRLAELGRNPLLLTLLALVARESLAAGVPLPRTSSRLYQAAVDLLLRRGYAPEPRGVRDASLARLVLRRLSLDLQRAGGEGWEEPALGEALWKVREDAALESRVGKTWGPNEVLLRDLEFNSGVIGPHDGAGLPWRYLHRSLREFLAAERLIEEGPEAIEAWAKAWAGAVEAREAFEMGEGREKRGRAPSREPPEPARWGEVYLLLCGLVSDPIPHLERLRTASSPLARRALRSVEGLSAERAFRFLFDTKDWHEDDVIGLTEAHGAPADDELWRRVHARTPLRELAILHYALTSRAGQEPDRTRFFAEAGRSLPTKVPATVEIPAGMFTMGSPEGEGEDSEHPAHRVTLTRPFRMGVTPVTVAQYRGLEPRHPGEPEHPAVDVSWYEARLFAAWMGGRLPTEAEWEYACRAGTNTRWWSGDTEADLERVGWFEKNARQSKPVGRKPENPWKLRDMHGLVWEWCSDWYGPYAAEAVVDPAGGPAGDFRVIRGGSAWLTADWSRSALRNWDYPVYRVGIFGFRLVLPSPPPAGSTLDP